MPVYKLTAAETGPGLKEAEAALVDQSGPSLGRIPVDKDGFLQIPPGRPLMAFKLGDGVIRYTARMQSLLDITAFLTREIGCPVLNETGLIGSFDFTLAFASPATGTANPDRISAPIDAPTGGPSLQKAVHDQLGLTLISAKELIDVLVIDHIDKVPTPN